MYFKIMKIFVIAITCLRIVFPTLLKDFQKPSVVFSFLYSCTDHKLSKDFKTFLHIFMCSPDLHSFYSLENSQ